MRVLMLTRYGRLGASSRLRAFQYADIMRESGIDVRISPLFEDSYIKELYAGRHSITAIMYGYIRRIFVVLRIRHYDVVWIEKEIFPWMPAILEIPFLFLAKASSIDYDDAIFHRYDQHRYKLIRWLLGNKIDSLMRRADLVAVGNTYLHGRAEKAGAARIEIIPTVINLEKYEADHISHKASNEVVIGWIGTPTTAPYLKLVSDVLRKLSTAHSIRCVAFGVNPDQIRGMPFEALEWKEETEVDELVGFDIGIMPLPDTDWARGKCGYKLIQYMACGLPVIASPVGVNRDIVRENVNGFLATSEDEWEHAATRLIEGRDLRRRMGREGRALVEREYSLQVHAPRLLAMMRSLVG